MFFRDYHQWNIFKILNVGLAFGLTLVSDKTDALLSISCCD